MSLSPVRPASRIHPPTPSGRPTRQFGEGIEVETSVRHLIGGALSVELGVFYLGGSFPRTHRLYRYSEGTLNVVTSNPAGSFHGSIDDVPGELAHCDAQPPDDGDCRDHHGFAAALRRGVARLAAEAESIALPPLSGGSDAATVETGLHADGYDPIADLYYSGDDSFDLSSLPIAPEPPLLPVNRPTAAEISGHAAGLAGHQNTAPSIYVGTDATAWWDGWQKGRAERKASDLAYDCGYTAARSSGSPVEAPSHYSEAEREAFSAGVDDFGREMHEEYLRIKAAEADRYASLRD